MPLGSADQILVAVKVLSRVETTRSASNQHELNGVNEFKKLLGSERIENAPCTFTYLSDDSADEVREHAWVTWYDARERNPSRSEYRLYYPSNAAMNRALEGDLMVLFKEQDRIEVLVAQAQSTTANQLGWFLGLSPEDGRTKVHQASGLISRSRLLADTSLAEILILPDTSTPFDNLDFDLLFDTFPDGLPTTAEFAEFARRQVDDDIVDDPDTAVLEWRNVEERLFKAIERSEIAERLDVGFHRGGELDVDGFVSFSLSIQNRRKARAGRSLEHHVRAILDHRKIPYSFEPNTENKSKPDFLFPSIESYHDPEFDSSCLRMLAVKTTCKDRWRQVLSEAEKIPDKHLLTLEPAISVTQTSEMRDRQLTLVLPVELHKTFRTSQRKDLMTVEGFLRYVNKAPLTS